MSLRHSVRTALGTLALIASITTGRPAAGEQQAAPLALAIARVSIAGTSNIHAYTASTTSVRVTRVQLGDGVAGPTLWNALVEPGGLAAFEISIPATTLSSPKNGLDKNMHKALKASEHPDITFRLIGVEPSAGGPGALRAFGILRVAGVEREVVLDMMARRMEAMLAVRGEVQLLMTDFGITPPQAMLGMLKTDPKVTVTFETVLEVPLT